MSVAFTVNINTLPIVANWVPYASFVRWAFQVSIIAISYYATTFHLTLFIIVLIKALIINEFKGETFTCDGGFGQHCLETGEDVIKTLSFDTIDLSRSLLGLGCCLIIFIAVAVFALERSAIKFLPLNFIGSQQKARLAKTDKRFDDLGKVEGGEDLPIEDRSLGVLAVQDAIHNTDTTVEEKD